LTASHFGLAELRAACAQFIDQNLHHGHACYMLEQVRFWFPCIFWADLRTLGLIWGLILRSNAVQANKHDPALFDKCVEFIAWNCTEVIETGNAII
jgi:hypothetical protein